MAKKKKLKTKTGTKLIDPICESCSVPYIPHPHCMNCSVVFPAGMYVGVCPKDMKELNRLKIKEIWSLYISEESK